MHFFDISTSKSAPKLKCFVHFDLEMCFAPQRHAIFHLFAHLDLLSSETFSFLIFFLSSSLPFSDSSHLCFQSVHIVGSLTSKFPSIIITTNDDDHHHHSYNYNYSYITLHYNTLIKLLYMTATNTTTTTLHYTTLHYTNYITTLQLQLHYFTIH